jgi:hypothetical protein
MGKGLQTAVANLAALISSPDLRRLRRISLGTVQWPGLPLRKYLSGGSTLTDSDRRCAEALRKQLVLASRVIPAQETRKAQFALITKMLLTYPVANASAQSGAARGEAYLEAVDDFAPEILAEAIKGWNRGEVGEHDYRWAPAPAVLRAVCAKIVEPLITAAHDLEALLNAVRLIARWTPSRSSRKPCRRCGGSTTHTRNACGRVAMYASAYPKSCQHWQVEGLPARRPTP